MVMYNSLSIVCVFVHSTLFSLRIQVLQLKSKFSDSVFRSEKKREGSVNFIEFTYVSVCTCFLDRNECSCN